MYNFANFYITFTITTVLERQIQSSILSYFTIASGSAPAYFYHQKYFFRLGLRLPSLEIILFTSFRLPF